jgi:hypothetical protein
MHHCFNVLGAIREGLDLEKITADVNTSSGDLTQMLLLNNFSVIPIVNNKKCVREVIRHTIMDAHLSPCYNAFSAKEHKGRFCLCLRDRYSIYAQ